MITANSFIWCANRALFAAFALFAVTAAAAETGEAQFLGRGGSPADKAGIRPGDVIVEFAGQKITNIYDYTYALDAVKIGVPVKVVVLRDGQRVEITVTPEPRPN